MTLIRRNENWLPSMFNDFFDNARMERNTSSAPAVNVMEHEKGYSVEIAAPGMTRDDFNVELNEDGNLVITVEKKQENEQQKQGHYLRREFSYSKFRQLLVLPEDIDKDRISAAVEHGVLSIELPKLPEETAKPQVRSIEVK